MDQNSQNIVFIKLKNQLAYLNFNAIFECFRQFTAPLTKN